MPLFRDALTLPICITCLLLASPVQAGNSDSLSNERIPVTSEELERHWQVDCAGSVRNLLALTASTLDPNNRNKTGTAASTHLLVSRSCAQAPDIQKCALIYNTPGAAFYQACPDYQAAGMLLQQTCDSHSLNSAVLQSRLKSLLSCN